MKKSTLISGIVAALILYLFGFLFYGLSGIMDGYLSEAAQSLMDEENLNHLILILGHLVWGFVMAMIYSKWARGIHNFSQGFGLGAMLGLMLGLGMALVWYATSTMYSSLMGVVVESVFALIAFGITGGVVSMVYAKTDDSSQE